MVGLQPMATFISASVNPDAALFAGFSLALWLGARLIRRGWDARAATALCAVTGLTIVSKATAYALVPGVLFALGYALWQSGLPRRASALARAGAPLLALAVPVLAWVAYARLDRPPEPEPDQLRRHADGMARQRALVPGQLLRARDRRLRPAGDLPRLARARLLARGVLGPLRLARGEPCPTRSTSPLAVATAAILAGGAWALRHRWRAQWPALAFFALVAGALFAGLHASEYRIVSDQGIPFNQGRYLLPLLPLLGLAAAATLTLLPSRRRGLGLGVLLGGLLALQIASLAVVAERFYA